MIDMIECYNTMRMPDFSTAKKPMAAQSLFCTKYGYSAAKALFFDGRITTGQAVGMVALDRDFIAQAEVDTKFDYDALTAARAVVTKWMGEAKW